MILHYGQGVFEGMKAYRRPDGGISLFRPQLNFERLNLSNHRLGIPQIDETFMLHALVELLKVEQDWVPHTEGASLYIRPFIIATDVHLGVHVSKTYKYMVILSPSGAYYSQGMAPVNIYIEDEYIRAVRGGTGEAKCPGNYAASLLAQLEAEGKGYVQVLWLDGIEKKYIEEVGSMNVFFVIDDELVTPALNGSVLHGITRRSVIEMAQHWGIVSERRIAVAELIEAGKAGPDQRGIWVWYGGRHFADREILYEDQSLVFNNGETGPLAQRLYDKLTGLQFGKSEDELGWTYQVT